MRLLHRSLVLLVALTVSVFVLADPAAATEEPVPPQTVVDVADAQVLQTRPAHPRVPAHDVALMVGMGLSLAGVVILRQQALHRWGPPRPALAHTGDLVDLRQLVSVQGPRHR